VGVGGGLVFVCLGWVGVVLVFGVWWGVWGWCSRHASTEIELRFRISNRGLAIEFSGTRSLTTTVASRKDNHRYPCGNGDTCSHFVSPA
jgi:hypothetical protein